VKKKYVYFLNKIYNNNDDDDDDDDDDDNFVKELTNKINVIYIYEFDL
jgi:hypothetical protein